MRSRLEVKILLLIVAALIAGFGTYAVLSIRRESDTLLEQHREKARLFGETVMVGIRNVMLAGKASFARALVTDARENLTFGALHVFDREANEVYQEEGTGILIGAGDPNVRAVLRDQRAIAFTETQDGTPVMTRLDPLPNAPECQTCHGAHHTVRGVTMVSLRPTLFTLHSDVVGSDSLRPIASEVAGLVTQTLAAGYRTIMLSGVGPLVDTLIERASALPYIERVQVYDRFGEIHFGSETNPLRPGVIRSALEGGVPVDLFDKHALRLVHLVPLKNEERCQVCHGQSHPWRGVMAVTFRLDSLPRGRTALLEGLTGVLQAAIGTGFESIMLVGKGSFVRSFINDVRTIDAFREIRVFDREANERFLAHPMEDNGRATVAEVLKSQQPREEIRSIGGAEYLVISAPLINGTRCQACHGKDHTVRGVVMVTASMAPINAAIARNERESIIAGIVTMLLVWGVLRYSMKIVVVQPIGIIGAVAQQVGKGDFNARAEVQSRDEIGQLAGRINEMVDGLRERFHLRKFVSQQTVDAVREADDSGVRLGGVRKTATVFFSDIRGFTSISERMEPEAVVTMLNAILSRQAEIVGKYGGDIDKFVGDELVAVFQGPTMVMDAVTCALEIQAEMGAVGTPDGLPVDAGIGIGINTGEMVMGAMGSEQRMDFTVIGDAVNLGARLCSAAKRGQILISGTSARHMPQPSPMQLVRLEPMIVKGKERPVEVYEVLSDPA